MREGNSLFIDNNLLIGVHIICPLPAINIILFSLGNGDKRLLILAIGYKVFDRF